MASRGLRARTGGRSLGRTAALFLSDGTLDRPPFRGSNALYDVIERACRHDRSQRFGSLAEFYAAWRAARLVK